MRAAETLLFFYAVGAAIMFFAALALGRLSVLSLRDVRAAEQRIAAEQAADEERPPWAFGGGDDVGRHGTRDGGSDGAPPEGQATYPPTYAQPTYAQTAPPPPPENRPENRPENQQ